METTTKDALPSSTFTRRQTRKLRSGSTRDKNAWVKLVRTSPNRMNVVNIVGQPKASTSMLTIEEEDGLPMRATKRTCHHPEPARPFAIPRDDSIDEAMSGFAFMTLDLQKPLNDRSNAPPAAAIRKVSSAFFKPDGNPKSRFGKMASSAGVITSSAVSRYIQTSTPPQDSNQQAHDFTDLEAADLSIIAPVPQFRFTGQANSETSQPDSQSAFTFKSVTSFTPLLFNPTTPKALPWGSSPEHQLPAIPHVVAATIPVAPYSTSKHEDIASLLQNRLALHESTTAMPLCTDPESQHTTTTEGQLASESDVDVLQPPPHRKRRISKAKVFSSKIANPNLRGQKRAVKDKPRSPVDKTAGPAEKKTKHISPSVIQSSKDALVGMQGTRGSLIRDIPAKADPEASLDELGLA